MEGFNKLTDEIQDLEKAEVLQITTTEAVITKAIVAEAKYEAQTVIE